MGSIGCHKMNLSGLKELILEMIQKEPGIDMLVGSIDDLAKFNNRPSPMLGLEVCQPVFSESFPDKGLCSESCVIVRPAAGNTTFRIKAYPFDTIRRTPRKGQD
jgi:hypothetical protein